MSFSSLLNRLATVTRLTDQIVDSITVAATVTVARQPQNESYLDIELSSSAGAGSFYITGLAEGVTTTEVLTSLVDGIARTSNKFSSITGITTSGFTSGSAVVKTTTLEGSPSYQTKSLYTNLRCRLYKKVFTPYRIPPGDSEEDTYILMSDAAYPLTRGDRATVDSLVYEAKTNSIPRYGARNLHHHETEMKKL